MHPLIPRFTNGNTALCAYTPDTPALFHKWLNDQDLINSMGDWSFMPFAYANRSPEDYVAQTKATTWLICNIDGDQKVTPIGYTGIFVKQRHRVGIFRIAIPDKKDRGQGHGYRATMMFLDWAFRYLDLFAVHLAVTASNDSAVALYRKCGFAECGRHSQSRHQPDGRVDEIHMEMLRNWWEANKVVK